MAITNLHVLKHLNGSPVQEKDLRRGLKVTFPSGMGGVFTGKCTYLDDKLARFESIQRDWPVSIEVIFDVPDLTDEEFGRVLPLVNKFDAKIDRTLLNRASELGYVTIQSWTQNHLTEKGIKRRDLLSGSTEK